MIFLDKFFLQAVELVTILGRAYMLLLKAGDVNFICWEKKFNCDLENGVSLNDLTLESAKLEKRLVEWKESLIRFRRKNPVMNYYSVEQCIYLQKHLFRLTKDLKHADELPSQFYTLLRFFAHDVSLKNIKLAFSLSHLSIYKEEYKEERWKKASIKSNFEKHTPDEIKEFVQILKDSYDISENIAWASIIKCFPFSISNALRWCHQQDFESQEIDDLEIKSREQLTLLLNSNMYGFLFFTLFYISFMLK